MHTVHVFYLFTTLCVLKYAKNDWKHVQSLSERACPFGKTTKEYSFQVAWYHLNVLNGSDESVLCKYKLNKPSLEVWILYSFPELTLYISYNINSLPMNKGFQTAQDFFLLNHIITLVCLSDRTAATKISVFLWLADFDSSCNFHHGIYLA